MISQQTLSKFLKGLYSAAVSVLGSLAVTLQGSQTFSDLTDQQWVALSLAGLVAGGGTFGLAGWQGPTTGTTTPNHPDAR
jgi:zinc transporter ZupT